MRWGEWKFSAGRAVQDRFVLWTTVGTVVLFVGMTAFLLIRLLPAGWQAGVLTLHYNIYLGIDDVRSWPWIFLLPGVALLVVATDVAVAYGMFRRDPLASRTLLTVGFVSTVLWAIGSFFLIIVNG